MRFTTNRLCVLAAAWMVLLSNGSFWHALFAAQGSGGHALLFAASMFVALTGLNMLLLRVLSPGCSVRVVLTLLLLLGAAAGWFMDTYGVALDTEMLRNVWQTNLAEARDFIGWPLAWRMLWQAGPAIAVVWMVRLPVGWWAQSLRDYALGVVAGIALIGIAVMPMYSSHASFFRNHHVARHLIAPFNVAAGSTRLLARSLQREVPFAQIGTDVARNAAPADKPLLVVMVVGETARAANFSLGGYARNTNPLLQQHGVYYFSNVFSCGTSTAVSVPCMFSDLPRKEFDLGKANRRDSVLDILQRAGLSVTWIENQSGCKNVCDRVPHETAESYHPDSCSRGECMDDTLLHALAAKLPGIRSDSVLLMHSMGSHGPAYYRRASPETQVFKPFCATERIETCSDEQIVNAYDNSIVYTDHVLAALIDSLAADQHVDSVLLYVSDHGESLGENGLYLHGQPFLIAPEAQKHVPMLMWFSSGALSRLRINSVCLRNRLAQAASHDNVSHTLMGLADLTTSAYRPALDSLRPCRL